jgi:hypothetical protein
METKKCNFNLYTKLICIVLASFIFFPYIIANEIMLFCNNVNTALLSISLFLSFIISAIVFAISIIIFIKRDNLQDNKFKRAFIMINLIFSSINMLYGIFTLLFA